MNQYFSKLKFNQFIFLIIIPMIFCSCASAAFQLDPFSKGFESVSRTQPHGVLRLERNERSILVKIDNKFIHDDNNLLELYLDPGEHEIVIFYYASYSGPIATVKWQSQPFVRKINVKEGQIYVLKAFYKDRKLVVE